MPRRIFRLSPIVGAALATAAALPAVWWEPLHVDEVVTLALAPRPFGEIVDTVFVEKGGAPLHFFVEHLMLAWPGALEGLRLPSLLFFLLALPASLLVGRELVGEREGALLAPALALAPLAVSLATFGRMYALFLAFALWASWASLRAARSGGRLAWALAGLFAGALVYVHPVAPVYVALVLAAGFLHAEEERLRGLVLRAWPALAAAVAVGLPYYLSALETLRDRYGVHAGRPRLEGSAGRSIPEQSLHALSPGGLAGAVALSLLAAGGLAWLLVSRRRSGLALALWLVVPIAFFSLVPAGDTRFFDRYLIPVLPFFLLAVIAGCLAVGRVAGLSLLGLGLALALVGWQAYDDFARLRDLRALRLPALVSATAPHAESAVLFSSTGAASAGRPPELLARYLALELPEVDRLREENAGRLRAFVAEEREPALGLWIFRAPAGRTARALERFRALDGVVATPLSPGLVLVRSDAPRDPRALVEQSFALRSAWLESKPSDPKATRLLAADRTALSSP